MTSGLTRLSFLLLCSAVCVLAASGLALQAVAGPPDTPKKETSQRSAATRPTLTRLTTDQQELALKFAREHHPELARLLEHLKKKSVPEFNRGIREVYNLVQRLERLREKQPTRYKSELDNWKRLSQIRLLVARWVMSQDPELEREIRSLLRKRQETKLQSMRTEREKLAERLRQLDKAIERGEKNLSDDVENEWNRLTKQASAMAGKHRRVKKDSQKPRTDQRGKAEENKRDEKRNEKNTARKD